MSRDTSVPNQRVLRRRQVLSLGATAAGLAVVGAHAPARAAGADTTVTLGPATFLERQVSPAYQPAFIRFAFSGNTAAAGAERWQWQGLQGDRAKPARVARNLVYATAVQRPSDSTGITQCMPPADVRDEWFLRDGSGRKLHRDSGGPGGDYALDPGHPGFQERAARFLIDKCRREGWHGILHDEINGELSWAFPGPGAAKYPTGDAYRAALLGYIRYLRPRLADAGFLLVGNIGEAHHRAWCEDLTRAGMVTSSESFVCGDLGRSGPMSSEDGQWTWRIDWLEWSLNNAPNVVMHDRQNAEGPTLYGLGTFLLVDNGRGVYGASTGYSASDPWLNCFTAAQSLGAPVGSRRLLSGGLWRRDFTRGYVLVNSSRNSNGQIPGTSGRIVLN